MSRRYSVVQWATGVVGSAAIRSVVRHPKLDLVGVKVYSEAKEGRDAGDGPLTGSAGRPMAAASRPEPTAPRRRVPRANRLPGRPTGTRSAGRGTSCAG